MPQRTRAYTQHPAPQEPQREGPEILGAHFIEQNASASHSSSVAVSGDAHGPMAHAQAAGMYMNLFDDREAKGRMQEQREAILSGRQLTEERKQVDKHARFGLIIVLALSAVIGFFTYAPLHMLVAGVALVFMLKVEGSPFFTRKANTTKSEGS